ncbi:hypothetical protein D3C84_1243550 [compost metagenome]
MTVEEVMQALRSKRTDERIPILRMELDYELATLQDALSSGDTKAAMESKVKLIELRQEMLLLEM